MNRIIFTVIAAATVLAACDKAEIKRCGAEEPAVDGKVSLTVSALTPTKVTFNDANQLVWEGDESVGVLLGNNSSTDTDATTRSTQALASVTNGIFSGTIDQTTFALSDVKGLVYPFNTEHYYRYDGSSGRIVMCVGADNDKNPVPEVQKYNNVLSGRNVPLFCPLSSSDLIADGDSYKVEGKQFRWGCALIRFNIYGRASGMTDAEVLKSVDFYANASKAIVGRYEYVTNDGTFKFNGSVSKVATVQLEEECTIADKTKDSGIKVFMALLPRDVITTGAGAYVKVTTDRAVYQLDIAPTSINLAAGEVRLIGLDMTKFWSDQPDAPENPVTLPSTEWIDEEKW